MPIRARLLIVGVVIAFVAAVIFGAASTPFHSQDVVTFTVLVVCAWLSIEGSLRVVWRRPAPGGRVNDLLAVWTLPVVLVLPPVYGALVGIPLLAVVQLRLFRRTALKLVFSAASTGLAGFAASEVHQSLVHHAGRWSVDDLVGSGTLLGATLACVVVRGGVNTALIASVIALTKPGGRMRDTLHDAEFWGVMAGESCMGVLVGLACAAANYAVLIALPPVLVLQRALLVAEFREAARTDAKTGLANSTYWREVADRALSRARGGREPLAVLLVDIDHFKGVNDRYGHLVGDEVLRSVANGLTHGLRPGDFVGRFGGEEFVVLLPGSDLEQARHAAERIRSHVAELSVEASNRREPVHVTISIGAAAFRESGHSVHELLDAADTALYAAKHAGRNCVRVAEGSRQQVLDLSGESGRVIDLRSHRAPVD